MAQFIETTGARTPNQVPSNAGTLIRDDEWGIDSTLSGYIIQSEDITEEAMTDTTQDQKGAVVSQLDYDHHYNMTLGVIGDATHAPIIGDSTGFAVGDIAFTYGGHVWKLNNVAYSGAYNDKKKWTITAERWTNWPQQPTI